MADLGTFAKRIRERGRLVEAAAPAIVRKAALVALRDLVLATPVDTGRARGNWQVEIGGSVVGESGFEDKSGDAAIRIGTATISTFGKGDGSIFIGNNVPYIGRLNEGSSAQAPAGFVEKAVRGAVNIIRKSKVLKA